MLRTTLGLSFILVLGGLAACSSKSTDNGSGGNGSIVGSGGSSTGGTSTNGAGTNNASAGKTSSGGATGTAGGTGVCADETITCVDATHAKGCNLDTGAIDTFSCVDEFAGLGFTSSGCTMDPTGDFCDVTAAKDMACLAGANAFAHCEGATTDEQLFNIYVNCFQDNMDGHAIISCFGDYVTPTKMTANDCLQAEEACFPGAGGAGPVDPGTAGAGGAP